jgi:hypothetical protein
MWSFNKVLCEVLAKLCEGALLKAYGRARGIWPGPPPMNLCELISQLVAVIVSFSGAKPIGAHI